MGSRVSFEPASSQASVINAHNVVINYGGEYDPTMNQASFKENFDERRQLIQSRIKARELLDRKPVQRKKFSTLDDAARDAKSHKPLTSAFKHRPVIA